MSGPLTSVLESFRAGVHSIDEVVQRTGLRRDVVDAAIGHLVRAGRLEARELAIGCPTGGCGSCASGLTDGSAGCGSTEPSDRRSGPVLVTLSLKRPR